MTLWVWGMGLVSVLLGGTVVKDFTDVSMSSPLKISLGKVPEGTTIEIHAKMKTEAQGWAKQLGIAIDGPYVYGAITSPMANGGIYKLPIERFLEKDTVSGSSIRKTDIKYFSDIKISCAKILPQTNKDSMNLQGSIPVTLVESDQLAAYDCPSSPFVKSEENAQMLVNDPCLKKGQGPGNYSAECLRQTILEAFENPSSCSADGEWYKSLSLDFGGKDREQIRTMVQNQRKNMATDPSSRRGCTGEDISTPCDSGLTNECLVYLYKNRSENNDKGQNGIEGVKQYRSDVFTNAIGNTDLKNENWNRCFGIPIAPKPPANVAKNATNDVIRAIMAQPAPAIQICNSTPVKNTVSRAAGDPTYLTLTGPGCVKKGEVFSVSAGGDWRQSAAWALWRQDGNINGGCKNPGCGFVAPNRAGTTTITYTLRGIEGKLVINVQ